METVTRRNKLKILVFGVLLVFASCNSNRIFDEYITLENNEWLQKHTVAFEFQIQDTISRNNLYIHIRNNNSYQYSNLYLITHIDFPNGKKVVDTLQYEMADKNGRFLGTGLSEVKESKLFFKENSIFKLPGNYKVFIRQAMRKNGSVDGIEKLGGITDVGFRIEKVK